MPLLTPFDYGGLLLVFVLLFVFIPSALCVCPDCWGSLPNCNYDTDHQCIGLKQSAAN